MPEWVKTVIILGSIAGGVFFMWLITYAIWKSRRAIKNNQGKQNLNWLQKNGPKLILLLLVLVFVVSFIVAILTK